MSFEELIAKFGIYLSTFIVCLASGFFPFVNAELYLVTVSAMTPKNVVFPLILISTVGQMLAKSVIYLTGRGILKLPLGNVSKKLDKATQKFQKWEGKTDPFIFLIAFFGVPPFYVVSILAGILRLNFFRFLASGFCGRFLRFSITVLFPQFIKGIF